jgi:hypothetical protein
MISSKKKFNFNLNQYRNAHYHTLNKAKKFFDTWLSMQNIDAVFDCPVSIYYDIYPKRKSDLMNYGAVIDKFLQDALVNRGVIPDDNVDVVKSVAFDFGGYDRSNAHADAWIMRV